MGTLIQHTDDLDRGHALMGYLWHAKQRCDLDLLVHLGFEMGQWSTVHALLNKLIDTHEILAPFIGPKNPAVDLEWSITDPKTSLDDIFGNYLDKSQLEKIKIPAPQRDLNLTTRLPAAENFGERLVGSVLLNLGSLILSAADCSPKESQLAMSCVFRVLARLHHLGLISDKAYQYTPADPSQASFRPPGLNILSTHIMTVLSDAAWLEHETTLANTATEAGEDPPFLPFNVGFRELGPEIWLELILWCCVEHGLPKHGAFLLGDMCTRTDDQAWKVASWAPLVRSLDTVRQTDISTEDSWRHPDKDSPPRQFNSRKRAPFNGLGRRTISTEVVYSIRDMMHNKSFVSVGSDGLSSSRMIDLVAPLTQLLEPAGSTDEPRLTNRSTNWNFNRMIESGGINPENDPVAFDKVLRSTQNVVPPWAGEPIPTDKRLNDLTKAQLYDETAAMSGLIQENIRISAYQKEAAIAFDEYAWLQSIIDASKSYHIKAFFENLSQSNTTDASFFDSQQLGSNLDQSSLPQLQSVVVAGLLDLITACRAFDFGNWLLFNNDIDGPSIAPASYGDQAMAPSILRFAAATGNKELSDNVISSLAPPLSANTLKAVVNLHISMESWDRALFTLEYMRDYRARSWGFSNITMLAAKIIRLDASTQRKLKSGPQSMSKEQESLARASDIFIRLFQGEFSTSSSKSERTNDWQQLVVRRLSSYFEALPGPLSTILRGANIDPVLPRDKIIKLPTHVFHDLLSAVVDVYGSQAGKQLFDEWCLDIPTPEQMRTQDGVMRLQTGPERRHRSHSGDSSFNAKWHDYAQSKVVAPDLNTIRILAQAAYREYEVDEAHARAYHSPKETTSFPPASSSQEPTREHEADSSVIPPATESEAVLDFCVSRFRRAKMSDSSIDLEIPGHLARMRLRGFGQNKHGYTHDRVKQVQDDSWMDYFLACKAKSTKSPLSGDQHISRRETPPTSPKASPKPKTQEDESADTKVLQEESAETKSARVEPGAKTKPAHPAKADSTETKSAQPNSDKAKPAGPTSLAKAEPAKSKSAKHTQMKSAGTKPATPTKEEPANPKSTEAKSTQPNPSQNQPTQSQPAPAESAKAKPKQADPAKAESTTPTGAKPDEANQASQVNSIKTKKPSRPESAEATPAAQSKPAKAEPAIPKKTQKRSKKRSTAAKEKSAEASPPDVKPAQSNPSG